MGNFQSVSRLTTSAVREKMNSEKDFDSKVSAVQFINENPALKYKFEDQLGKGACCTVYRVLDRLNRKSLACRIIKCINVKNQERLRREIAIMDECVHSNIVKHDETYLYSDCLYRSTYNIRFMFEEYMNGGTLTEFIYQFKDDYSEPMIAYVLGEILLGIAQIHG